jgi:hypothetical protein
MQYPKSSVYFWPTHDLPIHLPLHPFDIFQRTQQNCEGGQMVDGLGGQNQFHKRDPPSHINNLAIPGRELPSAFVLEVLEIYSRKAPNWK